MNQHVFSQASKRALIGIYCFVALPIVVYFSFIVLYASDGPFWDDYNIVLQFLIDYHDGGSRSERFKVLFQQFNEHRVFTAHLFHLLQYNFFGSVDFVLAIYVGNIAIVGIALIHLYQFRHSPNVIFIAAIITYLTFQLIPIVSIYVSSAGTAMHFSLFLVYLSFVLLVQQTWTTTILGTLVAVQSLFTLGSGVLVFILSPLMLFMCAIKNPGAADNYRSTGINQRFLIKQLILLELAGLVAAYCYSLGYVSHSSGEQHLLTNLYSPMKLIVDFIILLGFDFSYGNHTVAGVFGVVFVVLSVGLLVKGYHKRQPALAVFLLFLLASIFAICLGRDWRTSHELINQSRYSLFSIHIWVIVLIAYMDIYRGTLLNNFRVIVFGAVILLLFFSASYIKNAPLVIDSCLAKKSDSQSMVIRILKNESFLFDSFEIILRKSIERGYFNSDKLLSEKKPRLFTDRVACYTGLHL